MGFAFAAAIDNDKRLLPSIVGDEVSRGDGNSECVQFLMPPMHPCPILHSRRVYEQTVVDDGGKSKD